MRANIDLIKNSLLPIGIEPMTIASQAYHYRHKSDALPTEL